jgi:hypothetical protein
MNDPIAMSLLSASIAIKFFLEKSKVKNYEDKKKMN